MKQSLITSCFRGTKELLDLTVNPFREGLADERTAEPCAFVIFGASGDLTHRKLIPALFNLFLKGLLPVGFAIVGFARRPWTDDDFRAEMRRAIEDHSKYLMADVSAWESFAKTLSYIVSPFEDLTGYHALKQKLAELGKTKGTRGNSIFYLATPPPEYSVVVSNLGAAGLNSQENGWTRLIVEKPIGSDLASSRDLNTQLRQVFEEAQIYRIDHFLGKETVQNILVFRFANKIFEPLWNQRYIDNIQITIAETVGLEGRGGYFDKAGMVRDVVQNHGLQILTLVGMEPPVSVDADAIRDEKVKVLKAIRPLKPEEVFTASVRGQYESGSLSGKSVNGYLQEPNVAPDSSTETYAAIRFAVDSWRWAGVPFYLRVGKRMPKKVTEIALEFREVPGILFGARRKDALQPNLLIIRIQPDEGISLRVTSKVPGPSVRLQSVRMDFQYGSSFGTPSPEAYERLLLDASCGEAALFARGDEVDTAWQIITPLLDEWANKGREGLYSYQAGTWGPLEALDLLKSEGRQWRRL